MSLCITINMYLHSKVTPKSNQKGKPAQMDTKHKHQVPGLFLAITILPMTINVANTLLIYANALMDS